MTDDAFEQRIAAAIRAYADRGPTDVDPMAMTQLAAAGSRRIGPLTLATPAGRWLAVALLLLALLVPIVAGALAAANRQRPDPASIIGQHARIHEGFVFAYADGLVVFYVDIGALLPEGATRYTLLEGQLTPRGVDLVRSGALDPRWFLIHELSDLPVGALADQPIRPFRASKIALCPFWNGMLEPASILEDLPPAAIALVRGRERSFQTDALGQSPPVRCWAVTRDEAIWLARAINGAETVGQDEAVPTIIVQVPGVRAGQIIDVALWAEPILPHGDWVGWGG